MKTAKERYQYLIKDCLTPIMKANGFKKKGNKYILYGEELAYVLWIQRGSFNNNDFVDFSIDIEIYTREFENRKDLKTYLGILLAIHSRRITDNIEYGWIDLKTEDEDAEAKDQAIRDYWLESIEPKIIPYMLQFKTIRDLINLLENAPDSPRKCIWHIPDTGTQTIRGLAYLYWVIGDKQKAIDKLDWGMINLKKIVKAPSLQDGASKKLEDLKERIIKGGPYYMRSKPEDLI